MESVLKAGRYLFAIAIVAFGVENLVLAQHGDAITRIIPWLPLIPFLAYLISLTFLAAGICIALNFRARLAAILLGCIFLLLEIVLQIPRAVVKPLDLGLRTLVFEILTMSASAFLLAGILPAEGYSFEQWSGLRRSLIQTGRFFLAISSMVFGISHFIIPAFIASLIPPWIPGPGLFWAYLTAVAFVAAGVSIAIGLLSRWAAAMLGVMFLLWFLLLHLPRVLSYPRSHHPEEWSSAFIALGICGGSWVAANALSANASRAAGAD